MSLGHAQRPDAGHVRVPGQQAQPEQRRLQDAAEDGLERGVGAGGLRLRHHGTHRKVSLCNAHRKVSLCNATEIITVY